MYQKIEQCLTMNPNPVLSVEKDGTVLYSNEAGETLLQEWKVAVGEKLPSYIGNIVQQCLYQQSLIKNKLIVGKKMYLTSFIPVPEEEHVNIYGFDVSELDKLIEETQENEALAVSNLEFAEIIDIPAVQSLMDKYRKFTNVPVSMTDLNGNVLVSTGWQDICINFHMVHPEARKHCMEKNTKLTAGILPGEVKLYKCKNNMWYIATPILVENRHIGYIFSGQFFFNYEPLDIELFRSQARHYGFNEEEYLTALKNVPCLSRLTVDASISFFEELANLLSLLSYNNTKLAKSLSEQKNLINSLHDSEEKYRNIVETANEGIIIIDKEALITYLNKKMTDMLGYKHEEGIGRPIWDFISEESKGTLKSNLKNRRLGKDDNYEIKLIKKDGSMLWALVNAKCLFDKKGKFMGSMSMLTDITESKRVETELRENESRFRNLFDVIANGVAIFDVINNGHDFIFKDMNPAFERIFQIKRKNMIGKSLYELFFDAGKLGFDAAFKWVWLSGQQEFVPLTLYEVRDIAMWLTTNVLRLPTGELVAVFEDITERKQAYEEHERLLDFIQQEKDRLVALVNSITDEVWFADVQKNFTLVNPSALNKSNIVDKGNVKVNSFVSGLEIYRMDGSLRPIEEAPSLRALRGEIVKNQEEIVNSPACGNLRYRQVSASPVRDAYGNIIGSVSVVRDITENKRAEAARQKSEEQYRTLFNSMVEGFCIVDMLFNENEKPVDFVFIEANPAFEKHTGLSNIIGKRVRELIPSYEECWYEIYGRVALTGESVRYDNYVEGLNRWFEVYAYRIGEPLNRKVAIVFSEITERKIAEEKLRESEEKYRNIVETANEGIVIVNEEYKAIYVNKKMADMFGYSIEECIGKYVLDFISENDALVVKDNLKNRSQEKTDHYELKLRRKDGSYLWTISSAKSLFDKNGKFIGSLSLLTDITPKKEAEEELKNIEIARKKEIHHRIKNNLQVISSLLDLQADKFRNKKNIKFSEVLEAFKESQDRVVSMALIHEELYKGGGLEKLNFSPYVEELAENLLHTYSLGNNNISIKLNLEENIFFDMDIAVPLGMIINELVSNSFKHAFKGRNAGEIQIVLLIEEIGSYFKNNKGNYKGTSFALGISDNGVGIPANLDIEALDSLGLQLVSSLVAQLDGELEIKRSNGTEFIVKFTVAEKNNQMSLTVSSQNPQIVNKTYI